METRLPDLEYSGRVVIELEALAPTRLITFSSKNHTFTRLSLSFNSKTVNINPSKVTCKRGVCFFKTASRQSSRFNLTVWFKGFIKENALNGFYVSQSQSSERDLVVSTQFEPESAKTAFPCIDTPAFRTAITIEIKCPSPYHAISNMPIDSSHLNAQIMEFNTFKFKKSPPMSIFLVGFVISKMKSLQETVGSTTVSVFYSKSFKKPAKLLLKSATSSLKCVESLFKIEYPLEKLDFVPVEYFGGEGMENFGLIILEQARVMLPQNASVNQLSIMDLLVSHEIVHQWFGDLVSIKSWKDLWLAEGLAEFFQYHCATQTPKEYLNLLFYKEEVLDGFDADSVPSLSRSLWPRQELSPGSLFDGITYDKGASVLRMMQTIYEKQLNLTDCSVFCNRLGDFLRMHKWSGTSIEEFTNFFNYSMIEWLEYPGFPLIDANFDTRNCILHLKQKPFALDPNYSPQITWNIPLFIENTNGSVQMNVMSTKSSSIYYGPCQGKPVLLNSQGIGFFKTNYSLSDLNNLKPLNSISRASLLTDILATANLLKALPVIESLLDSNWLIWYTLEQKWAELSLIPEFTSRISRILASIIHNEENEQLLMLCLKTNCDSRVVQEQIDLFHYFLDRDLDQIQPSMLYAAVVYDNQYDLIAAMYTNPAFLDYKQGFLLNGLVYSNYSKTLLLLKQAALQDHVPALKAMSKNGSDAHSAVLDYIIKAVIISLEWTVQVSKAKMNDLFEQVASLNSMQQVDACTELLQDARFERVSLGIRRGLLKAVKRLNTS